MIFTVISTGDKHGLKKIKLLDNKLSKTGDYFKVAL
jgi:hypothetical protein